MRVFERDQLATADLVVDAVYRGSRAGNAGDDPLPPLLAVSNHGGFRYRGSKDRIEMLVLTSSNADPDWPDELDVATGVYTYYGDNKHPGRELHATPRHGNEILRDLFSSASSGLQGREQVPPVFLFRKAGDRRDVAFLGLAIPGTTDRREDDLVALWRATQGRRFQNYRAKFTVLDCPTVSRAWIDGLIAGEPVQALAPPAWQAWRKAGTIAPLLAPTTVEYRSRAEQMPTGKAERAVLSAVHGYFANDPYSFEKCAVELARLMIGHSTALEVTRKSADGGRDAIGLLWLGQGASAIVVDFALEAKCFAEDHGVGVRELSRLISRLRHRQFGVLVTTSYVGLQAYKEIKEDRHPIIVISGRDIAETLRRAGLSTPERVIAWLQAQFPLTT